MSIRSRVRNVLIAATSALAAVGIAVIGAPPSPRNVGLDCHGGFCVALLEPPAGQCPALMSRVDPGGPPGRVLRVLEGLRDAEALSSWVALLRDDDPTACYVEVRLTVDRVELPGGGFRLDGQAPAWRDVIDAAALGSIVVDGQVNRRPAYARRDVGGSPCRAHVFLGEDPCEGSDDITDTVEDAGP